MIAAQVGQQGGIGPGPRLGGTIPRYVLGGLVQSGARTSACPWGTLTMNLLGCFGIGLSAELSETRGQDGRLHQRSRQPARKNE